MALVICKDCQKEFSSDAKQCPGCGAKKPKPPKVSWKRSKLLKIAAGVFVLALLMHSRQPIPTAPTPEQQREKLRDNDLSLAKHACHQAIVKQANDPDSVVFDDADPDQDYGEFKKVAKGGENIITQAAFRARNGFGGYQHAAVDCTYLYTPKGGMLLLKVSKF